MRFTQGSLLLVLLACSLSPVHGVLETYNTNLKCKCMRETFNFVSLFLIGKLQIFPPGNGCPNTEIIAWMKNKSVICLNPRAKWTQKLMRMSRKSAFSTSPAPVFKKMIA
ncbi:C-X-C motif chemokine 13 [Orcinus orca]|uniref:C-X-C motif chemokine 13 n=1 Tax=Orcinus orca TaxID=9733 RepID=UPI0002BCE5E4|nr:C-X-C motif chemokine 13 [Orcinus orca]XP_026943409.1 C-X-C motif chemokine 13 [Lagenorhynchus obliquidens]XP_030733942.1 C-X-C motif chemokine 13 [Globicephala melas]XP_060003016.1 C-X-C motif chemokine 13 [Lagenorhynchus albirostris]